MSIKLILQCDTVALYDARRFLLDYLKLGLGHQFGNVNGSGCVQRQRFRRANATPTRC